MAEKRASVRFIEQAILAQEDERARIARELHDGIGQSLTSLLVGLRSLETALKGNAQAQHLASQLRDTTAAAIDEVRTLAHGLRPAALDDLGLGPAVERLVADMAGRHGFPIDLQVNGVERLAPTVEITVYRIVQEALNNVAKHAKAKQASVILEQRGGNVRIIVEDDGQGMPESSDTGGFGLQGIRERVGLVRGTLTLESAPEHGTTLFVSIPCEREAPLRFWLRLRGNDIPLSPGVYVIGRSPGCEIQIDHRRASRHHARLCVGEHEATIEDIGSTNGVFLSGARVLSAEQVSDGDVVVIGEEELVFHAEKRAEGPDSKRDFGLEQTLPGRVPRERVEPDPAPAKPKRTEETEKADVLELVGAVASRLLAQGRAMDAERALAGHLERVIEAAREGGPIRATVLEAAVSSALSLAVATRNPRWADYAVELLSRTSNEPPDSLVETLEAMAEQGVTPKPEAMHAFVRGLRASAHLNAAAMDRFERLRAALAKLQR